jgi:hypothetical protein
MVKGITTLPKRKMFPASVLLPNESEIYSRLLEANLSQGPKGRGRSRPEHTQQALFAEKLRRDNFKKPLFHPHPTAHREGIAAHQELRTLRSVTDKLQDMLRGITQAPQIQKATIANVSQALEESAIPPQLARTTSRARAGRGAPGSPGGVSAPGTPGVAAPGTPGTQAKASAAQAKAAAAQAKADAAQTKADAAQVKVIQEQVREMAAQGKAPAKAPVKAKAPPPKAPQRRSPTPENRQPTRRSPTPQDRRANRRSPTPQDRRRAYIPAQPYENEEEWRERRRRNDLAGHR